MLRTKIIPGLPSRISVTYPTDDNMPESGVFLAAENADQQLVW